MRNGSSKACDHPMRDQPRVVGQALHQDGELVTAHPRDRVARPHAAENPFRGQNQQRVSGRMTEAVVDQLEIVEIQRQHRHRLVVALCNCIACVRRSLNSTRFARPVSGSRNA